MFKTPKAKKRRIKKAASTNRLITYVVQLCNNTDSADDEVVRVKARSCEEATDKAYGRCSHRFSIGNVYTLAQYREFFK